MRDWYIPVAFAVGLLAWLVFLAWFFAGRALADDEDLFGENNAQYGTFDKYNRPLLELRQTGVHRWEYVQEGRTNIRDVIAESLDDYGREFGFAHIDTPGGWKEIASGGMAFIYGNSLHGPCGSGAIGCLPDFLTTKQAVVYDADTMAPWPRNSKKEVVNHEECHNIGNCAEGYIHTGGQIRCAPLDTPQHRSFMNCGLTNNQLIDDYIRSIWAKSHYPDGFKNVCGPGRNLPCAGAARDDFGFFVWFCEPSKDYKVTRIALLNADGSWAGVHFNPDQLDGNRCRGHRLPEGVYKLKRESALSWPFAKNEVVVGS